MASPFPGMDPFIEGQEWEDFHSRAIAVIAEALLPMIRPRYIARVEVRVYLEHESEERIRFTRPDVWVAGHGTPGQAHGTTAVALEPVTLTLPMPVEEREPFVTIRTRANLEVVTVIEMLSPGNKRAGSDGHQQYLNKRDAVLCSTANLVELDLLRGGERLPVVEALPPGDYYALVSRARRRPEVDVYGWHLSQTLPQIPVPLAGSDPDAVLDLQQICSTAYDRAGYDYSLDYTRPASPPLSETDAEWVRQVLAGAGRTPPTLAT